MGEDFRFEGEERGFIIVSDNRVAGDQPYGVYFGIDEGDGTFACLGIKLEDVDAFIAAVRKSAERDA